ncbi:MAG: ABC transporter ATP-binding protein [Gaiellales bacterium]
MNGRTLVEVSDVSKRFVRRAPRPETVKGLIRDPFAWRRRDGFWALRDVNLSVAEGETVGLIGPNGSGKSTLLRLIGGVGRPSAGAITTARPVDAILSLGDGLDPYLTGRENAIATGVLGGLRRREIVARLDEIAEFAELGDFFDRPLRTYSEGMKLRLAFAAATTIEPEILLLDEVLSVGDLRFQEKCFRRMRELQAGGTAILFASHDESHVEQLCDRVVWLRKGAVVAQGPADEVLRAYADSMHLETDVRARELAIDPIVEVDNVDRSGTFEVEITDVRISPAQVVAGTTPITVELDLLPHVAVRDPIVSVSLQRRPDLATMVDINTEHDEIELGAVDGPRTVTLMLDRIDLRPGDYSFSVGVFQHDWEVTYDYRWNAYPFKIVDDGRGTGRSWATR